MRSDLRHHLDDVLEIHFYDKNISTDDKGKISAKTICVGPLLSTDEFNKQKECAND